MLSLPVEQIAFRYSQFRMQRQPDCFFRRAAKFKRYRFVAFSLSPEFPGAIDLVWGHVLPSHWRQPLPCGFEMVSHGVNGHTL
jgi:hypothetical protein